MFPAFVTESVSPAQQFGEHVLIFAVVWFNPRSIPREYAGVVHLLHLRTCLMVNLLHPRTYGLLLSSLLYLLMSLVPPDIQRRRRHDRLDFGGDYADRAPTSADGLQSFNDDVV